MTEIECKLCNQKFFSEPYRPVNCTVWLLSQICYDCESKLNDASISDGQAYP